jgi:Na+-exporting ATPase
MKKNTIPTDSSSTTTTEPLTESLPAHSLPISTVVTQLSTRLEDGLTASEATHRLQIYGPNKLDSDDGVSIIKILVHQIANAMMLVS